MTKDEALKMAIEAMTLPNNLSFLMAITACKEALEQPSVAELNDEYLRDTYVEGLSSAQQPVGWMDSEGRFRLDFRTEIVRNIAVVNKEIPLYTNPASSWQGNKEFVGLSDDEILEIDKSIDPEISIGKGKTLFARAIEQELKTKNGFSALKEKNT